MVLKMAQIIQVKYPELDKLISQIHNQADQISAVFKKVQSQTATLATSWKGEGAEQFQREMEDLVFPAFKRFSVSLGATEDTLRRIKEGFREAEEEAVQQLGVTRDEMMHFIEPLERREHKVYLDSRKIPTIGVGFNLTKPGARQRIEALGLNYDDVLAGRQTLTDPQIDELLRQDVQQAMTDARDLVSNFDQLPHAAQMIVVDMAFNMGKPKFSKFKNAIDALENEDFARAANEMQYRNGNGPPYTPWYQQTGNRARNHVETMRKLATRGN
jgi:WXG100 family type VII secretion target